ncbi:lasso peptide biosynthesis B2 protein [Paenibacillus hunanensis]|uniref:lasso peptide biosynthesis B2 protein n=1 Tax=Paenibacillus hunanensis TaxID=539262 RepID=UPI002A6B8025|nr:lasso peptide biosynthesis B2 protein [Paenibacillus hunanensis]WPP40622.1 lasso peptide biosynthesis B2 protein [Paenibacillus hunanensis]
MIKALRLDKLSKLRSYPADMRRLMLEALIALAWGRVLKQLPFARVSPSLGDYMKETSYESEREQHRQTIQISRALHLVSPHVPWEAECLVMAFAAQRMLNRRRLSSTLYLGMRRDEKGKTAAHAWLRSGRFYLTGAKELEQYTVVGQFAKGF